MEAYELEAKMDAKKYISSMLQYPEQLDKLQHMKKQETNKMVSKPPCYLLSYEH